MCLPLVLIGLLGAGKSSIGKLLAIQLKLNFYDADALFEQQVEQPIASFFTEEGEDKFRSIESSILATLMQNGKAVIATGGGVILDAQNRALISKKSLCIYLDADVEVLYKRLQGDRSRPLLQNTDLKQRLEDLKMQRKAYYEECAHIIIDIKEKGPDQIVKEIVEALQQRNDSSI